ncbi:type III secretion system inner rod subunit SctI [Pandoraea anhela]|uniref:EscI/YscI/HrpB family type III secretion system inner rod protein n=1 Tax=Pandoraea anhela TaxID=2508295 RepID=A0A5E4YIP4_9BURK|nr:type III secretion system inner rod subunit SctI [Pandoraea anhela]VVE48407.1 EscI/YscI/HrpB family type III secretion system inner rod protein [Pandoraea anhela]
MTTAFVPSLASPSSVRSPTATAETSAKVASTASSALGGTDIDAARFEQALANAPSLPEHQLLSAAGKLAGNTEHLAQRVALDERTLDDPTQMLAAQREISERVLALEIVAKVAGATTQGVNKLVHMQ